MNTKQLERMQYGKGFIAALDQSGGSTPKALKSYGIDESAYSNDKEMFDLIQTFLFKLKKRIYNQKQYCLAKNVITG